MRFSIPEELAYAAGLFDGEGCIYTERERPVVQVRMCHHAPEWLHENWGGCLDVEASHHPEHRATLRWRARGNDAERFLRHVAPYLRVKGPQADLAIVLTGLKPCPERADLCRQIRALNKRGM